MSNIIELQKKSSHPFDYNKTHIKEHGIYVSIPKIGTEISISGRVVRTDQGNRVVVFGTVGEIYTKREEVINLLKNYETDSGECIINSLAMKNSTVSNKEIFNAEVINKYTKVINGVPIMDWVRFKPKKEYQARTMWSFFVPKEACFEICGAYSEEYSGNGNYIVCEDMHESPNFATRRVINGKIFDTTYARTRAFDNIQKNFNEDYKQPIPKSWISKSSTQGIIVTFKNYNEKVFDAIQDSAYVSRGYNIGDTNENSTRLVTNIFILKKYAVVGESYLTKDKRLIYRLVYKDNAKHNNGKEIDEKREFEFSSQGFSAATQFVKQFIQKLEEKIQATKFVKDYSSELCKVFDDWYKRLISYDKHNMVRFIDTPEINSNTNILKESAFECYKECNNEYVVGTVTGGMLVLEKKDEKYYFTLTLIIDDEAIEFKDKCTSKGIMNLSGIYVNTLLK